MPIRTPIQEHDQKFDIMDHVNQDHSAELLAIAQCSHPGIQIDSAILSDIYQEGVLLAISAPTRINPKEVFVPFELEGELEEQILYLAYTALLKQNGHFGANRKRFFEVLGKQKLSPNLTRLSIQSNSPLPEYYPGYAYGLILQVMKKRPKKNPEQSQLSWIKRYFDYGFLWLMKKLSSRSRQRLLQKMNKDIRLYTLRSAWKSHSNAAFLDRGYIDIFTHGNSPGSQWVAALETNDIIFSRTETDDKHQHLQQGQTVLIADETAYAAIAGILDWWQNRLPPYLIILSADKNEQAYFSHDFNHNANNRSDKYDFFEKNRIKRIICPPEKQGEQIIQALQKIPLIEGVWGAFENESAKKVRHYLRNQRGLQGKTNHIKGYWRLNTN